MRLSARLSPECVAASHVAALRGKDVRAAAALTLQPWGTPRSTSTVSPDRDSSAPAGDRDGGAALGGAPQPASEWRARLSRAGNPSSDPGSTARGQLGASLLGCAEVSYMACRGWAETSTVHLCGASVTLFSAMLCAFASLHTALSCISISVSCPASALINHQLSDPSGPERCGTAGAPLLNVSHACARLQARM